MATSHAVARIAATYSSTLIASLWRIARRGSCVTRWRRHEADRPLDGATCSRHHNETCCSGAYVTPGSLAWNIHGHAITAPNRSTDTARRRRYMNR